MVRKKLAEAGIQTSVHYPAVHRFSIYDLNDKYFPNTSYVADNEITLPMYSNLGKDDINKIILNVKKFF
jgi:dTDP-4-amino-4,6-dideoxygalactose transaminase